MRRELHYFDIFPKIVPTRQSSRITVRCLERGLLRETAKPIKVKIIPLTESTENVKGAAHPVVQAEWIEKELVFDYQFQKEQQYHIDLYLQENQFIRLSVYALEEDLYARVPLKGDLHVHSNYSDGWESPEVVAAHYRKSGYDFMVISDHGNYTGSVDAIDFYQNVALDLNIVHGEEVHAPDNHIHIVNFGGEFSVNDYIWQHETEYRQEVTALSQTLTDVDEENRFEYASCQWIYDKIRQGNGLAIYAHPHWIIESYHVRDSMSLLQFKNKLFDAFELVGGMSPAENNIQLALYYDACANGYGGFPTVGSSDSHGTVREPFIGSSYANYGDNPYGFDEFFTVVLAPTNDKDAIIDAVKNGYAVAVDRYRGETAQVYGSYRLTGYVLFLLSEYFPLHEAICYEEGRLMKLFTFDRNEDVKKRLEQLSGRSRQMWERYASGVNTVV